MYGQKNYLQIQGINGKYRIDQIGCFLTAFCNLEARKGRAIDPVNLNAVFRDRGIYVDVDDGIRDDLGWGSITSYDPHITVVQTGTGWPNSNDAIVKFHYRSVKNPTLPNGQPNMIDHFCLVADHTQRKIIDSYDSVEKVTPYGEPVAFAVYADNTPQPVSTPAPAPQPAGKKLFLPSSTGTWRVYKIGGLYTVGNEIGRLATSANPPGLTYDILGTIATNIYKIHTETWGDVAIYAGSDTVAQFVNAAPAAPPPAPAPADDPSIKLIKAEAGWGVSYLAKAAGYPAGDQPGGFGSTIVWDRIAQANGKLNASLFHVVLDQTYRVPTYKAEDYAPAPVVAPPAPAPEPTPTPQPAPVEDKDGGETITVNVDKEGWKNSYKEEKGVYVAQRDAVIKDLDGKFPDAQLIHKEPYNIAGSFSKLGIKYYRTENSVIAGSWHGIHEDLLEPKDLHDLSDPNFIEETRKALGNFTRAEKVKNFFEKIKQFLLRRIAKVEAKQNKGA
jgi:hypothetical protein